MEPFDISALTNDSEINNCNNDTFFYSAYGNKIQTEDFELKEVDMEETTSYSEHSNNNKNKVDNKYTDCTMNYKPKYSNGVKTGKLKIGKSKNNQFSAKSPSMLSLTLGKITSLFGDVEKALSGRKAFYLERIKHAYKNNNTQLNNESRSIPSRRIILKNQASQKADLLFKEFDKETDVLYNINKDKKIINDSEISKIFENNVNSEDVGNRKRNNSPAPSLLSENSFIDNERIERLEKQVQDLIQRSLSFIPPPPPPPPVGFVIKNHQNTAPSSDISATPINEKKYSFKEPAHTPKYKMNAMLEEMREVKLRKVDENVLKDRNHLFKENNSNEIFKAIAKKFQNSIQEDSEDECKTDEDEWSLPS
ncbi:hypothetical protein HDU92_008128 [Lobulomyces angularis]|nr:hypothetical protein HDU92_008128 [Lobulomyces angularis]